MSRPAHVDRIEHTPRRLSHKKVARARASEATPPSSKASASSGEASVAAIEAASDAGLRYVLDNVGGIARVQRRGGFHYQGPDGKPVRARETLARIKSLVIPPAWSHVWISPYPRGHLQATGRDARGRKQYRYHADWRRMRDDNKYERLPWFVRALPAIRRQVRVNLKLPGLPREKVMAAVVRLLEKTFIRIGNERYAREHGSYGLTTLRNRHVRVRGNHIKFQFRGKSGKNHAIELDDTQVANILRRCRELPGYELFQYLDDEGARTVDSADVNAYLKDITGEDYTAKDFRTWGGTLLAGLAFAKEPPCGSGAHAQRVTVNVIRTVADDLGNTPAICRKCYVDPRIIDAYRSGIFQENHLTARGVRGLSQDEVRILRVLEYSHKNKIDGRKSPRSKGGEKQHGLRRAPRLNGRIPQPRRSTAGSA